MTIYFFSLNEYSKFFTWRVSLKKIFILSGILCFVISGCGKSDEQIKKEITTRVVDFSVAMDKVYNPDLKEENVIKDLLPFVRPGLAKETTAKSFYDSGKPMRNYLLRNKKKYIESGYKKTYEVREIILNETKTEANVLLIVLIEGMKSSGKNRVALGKGEKTLCRYRNLSFVFVEGQWYRDSEKSVKGECE